MKTRNEEIEYLGQMLTATRENDTMRIASIASRLLEISVGFQKEEMLKEESVLKDR